MMAVLPTPHALSQKVERRQTRARIGKASSYLQPSVTQTEVWIAECWLFAPNLRTTTILFLNFPPPVPETKSQTLRAEETCANCCSQFFCHSPNMFGTRSVHIRASHQMQIFSKENSSICAFNYRFSWHPKKFEKGSTPHISVACVHQHFRVIVVAL